MVKKQTQVENQAINKHEELQPPTNRACRRSLPPEAINNEIPEYYSGKRVGPGELKELERFKVVQNTQIKATINDCNTLFG